jgi:hypothetical protein
MDVGNVPVIYKVAKLIFTTFSALHVIPDHGVLHTELTGIPPLHRQPVTSVLVPRLVEAVKSHIAVSDGDTVGNVVGVTVGIEVGSKVGTQFTASESINNIIESRNCFDTFTRLRCFTPSKV